MMQHSWWMHGYVEKGSPPSSYAVAAVLDGEPGGWPRVILGTAQRAVILSPGLFVAGVRGQQLLLGAAFGSVGITLSIFALYSVRRAGRSLTA